jgi:hypothetical protein
MLRHIMDDVPANAEQRKAGRAPEPFARTLHKLRERYAGKPVTIREVLQGFAEELPPGERYEGKKRLDWFYEGWINGTAIPHLQLQNVKLAEAGRSMAASGTILQKNAPNELVTSVPLFAQLTGNRRVLVARIFADGPDTTFRIPVPAGTQRLLLDPENTVLRN